jgi:integrase
MVRLSNHLKSVHKEEEEVRRILALPKKEQHAALAGLRKKAILNQNIKLLESDAPKSELIREYNRQPGCKKKKSDATMCGNCKGFFSSKFIWKHKSTCSTEKGVHVSSIPLSALKSRKQSVDPEYQKEVLNRFRVGEQGDLCRQDYVIRTFGYHQWEKNAKGDRKVVMNEMRNIAKLVIQLRKEVPGFTGEDLFDKENFDLVTESMKTITMAEKKNQKHSLKVHLAHNLRSAAKIMQAVYLIKDQTEKATEVEVFLKVLAILWKGMVNKSVYKIKKRGQQRLRKPQRLPEEKNLRKIKDYISDSLKSLGKKKHKLTEYEYNRLRSLLACRLTLFNARRGGEPAKMTMQDWLDAESDVWVDKQRTEKLYDYEKQMLDELKLAYMEGKSRQLVAILIPIDCLPGIRKLVKLRSAMGVNNENTYLFAAGRGSMDHIQGSQAINEVCQATGTKLTATDIRHRTSTLYALLDLPEKDMRYFYTHMGHSKEISEDIYQCPHGIRAITKVGYQLQQLDNGSKGKCNWFLY